jgi:septin family protein
MAAADEGLNGCSRVLNVMLIGPTGAGKSSMANVLIGESIDGLDDDSASFSTSPSMTGHTTMCKMISKEVDGDIMLNVIDTPGVPDTSSQRTMAFIDEIINYGKENQISAIIYLIKPGRLSNSDRESLRIQSPVLKHLFNCAELSGLSPILLFRVHGRPDMSEEQMRYSGQAAASKWINAVYGDNTVNVVPEGSPDAQAGLAANQLLGCKFQLMFSNDRKCVQDPREVSSSLLHSLSFCSNLTTLSQECLTATELVQLYRETKTNSIDSEQSMTQMLSLFKSQICNNKRTIEEQSNMLSLYNGLQKGIGWIPYIGMISNVICSSKIANANERIANSRNRISECEKEMSNLDINTCTEKAKKAQDDLEQFEQSL